MFLPLELKTCSMVALQIAVHLDVQHHQSPKPCQRPRINQSQQARVQIASQFDGLGALGYDCLLRIWRGLDFAELAPQRTVIKADPSNAEAVQDNLDDPKAKQPFVHVQHVVWLRAIAWFVRNAHSAKRVHGARLQFEREKSLLTTATQRLQKCLGYCQSGSINGEQNRCQYLE